MKKKYLLNIFVLSGILLCNEIQAATVGTSASATGNDATAVGNKSKASGSDSVAIGSSSETEGDNSVAVGSSATAFGANSVSIGNVAASYADDTVVIGNGASSSENQSVAIGSQANTDNAYTQINQITIGNNNYSGFSGTAVGQVSVGMTGFERQVKNVAPGEISSTSTDAINGSQIYSILANGLNLPNNNNQNNNNPNNNNNNNTSPNFTIEDDYGTILSPQTTGNLRITGKTTSNLTEGNIGVVSTGTDTLEIRLAENINLGSNGTLEIGKTKISNNGVIILNGPSITEDGIDAGSSKITNVADGTNPTDAVNKAQLDEVRNSILGMNNQDFQREIKKTRKEANAGTASAIAMAVVPQVMKENENFMSIGMGVYKDESAVAFGYSRSNRDGKMVFKTALSVNSRAEIGFGIGIGKSF